MADVSASARSAAPPQVVWDVLVDHDGWAGWTDVSDSVRIADGDGHPDGVGSVREVWFLSAIPLRETVVTFDPEGYEYAYAMDRVAVAKDYVGRVQLDADGDGTRIRWSVTARPLLPLPGADQLNAGILRLVCGRLASGLAREAARRVPA
jgi:hypothetical protein